MNKLFLPILLFFFGPYFSQNQTIDSLKLALKNAKHDTVKCIILNELAETAADDEWPLYNEQLFKLAKVGLEEKKDKALLNTYKKFYAAALVNKGYLASIEGNPDEALKFYKESFLILQEVNDVEGMAGALNNMGVIYKNQGNISSAIECYEKSMAVYVKAGETKNIATSMYNLGIIYTDQGDVPKAIEFISKSLELREKAGDTKGVAISLVSMGMIHKNQKDFPTALKYYQKGFDIMKKLGDQKGAATALSNMGSIYKNQGDNVMALKTYQESLKIYKGIGYKQGESNLINNIGIVYMNMGDLPAARSNFMSSLEISEAIHDKAAVSNCLLNIGNTYFREKNNKQALDYITRSLKMSQDLGFPANIKNAAELLDKIYRNEGKYKEALTYYEIYIKMNDSTNNESNRKAATKQYLKYEYDKKAAADSVKVVEEKKVVAAQLKQEKTQRFALYGGLLLVLIFAGFMFNRVRITQRQNKVIQLQKLIVEEKHKEITDSINYAERIQRSFLATKELLNENLNDYFIVFRPKDIVSGDFYWAASAKASAGNTLFYICVADSTGHGVPGAIMSLLNVTSLEKAIEYHRNPADILNHTRQIIIDRLKKDGSNDGGKDGMDCSLLGFDFANKQLHIAAANNPVWIIRQKEGDTPGTPAYELIEIKPDKMPVGRGDQQDLSFTLHHVELQKGDAIYALTDGFPDQFGGANAKKFMSKNLKKLLLNNAHLSMDEQKMLLETTFKNWMGNLEQVDDVCVFGVKI